MITEPQPGDPLMRHLAMDERTEIYAISNMSGRIENTIAIF
jgi:hypothetical protein